ncbi:MAG TPA: lamin tail domain-containing protein [Myxococcota bacterium]|nr:lamin tail domain-containing protein [Myxococcota bacterium]
MKRTIHFLLASALAAGLAAPSARAVQISEVLYDATGSDNGKVFVELWGAAGTSLEGYKLEGVNGGDGAVGPTLALTGTIPADGFFVVGDTDGTASQVANVDLVLNFDLQNGPDSVVLRDALGNALDSLGYGTFAASDVFAGEGSPAPGAAAGQSVARLFANRDTNDNAADFGLLDVPTPGTGPIAAPEPALAATLAAALGSLGALRRRTSSPSTVG